jgi:hypothetical protein
MFIPDPDLEFLPIPDPGVKRHRFPDPDPQHCCWQWHTHHSKYIRVTLIKWIGKTVGIKLYYMLLLKTLNFIK